MFLRQLFLNLDIKIQVMESMQLALLQIPAHILCIFLCNWKYLGRRGTNCLGLIVAGVVSLISIPLILDGGKTVFIRSFG